MMKSFYEFLNEQDAPKPGRPFPLPQQQQIPQQGQQSKIPDKKPVFDFYRNINDTIDDGVKTVADYVNAHPQKNQWFEGAKLMNLYTRIKQDVKASEALLRPLLEVQL